MIEEEFIPAVIHEEDRFYSFIIVYYTSSLTFIYGKNIKIVESALTTDIITGEG